MEPSIWHAAFKVEWAKKHLDSLGEMVRALKETGGKRITPYEDMEHSEYVIVTQHPPESDFFRLILTTGDFVSSLRASLDHLARQLALLTPVKPSGELTFPILEKNTLDAQVRFAKITFGIPETAIALMKSMQPYHAGDDYKSTHLWRLNKLWNIDKHRHLAGFREHPDTWEIRLDFQDLEDVPVNTEQIGNQTIMRLPLSVKEKVHFNPSVKVDFEIDEPSEGIVIRYEDLVEMYEFVANSVFPAFAGFFPEHEVPGQAPRGIEF